jgi:hypothetical protein
LLAASAKCPDQHWFLIALDARTGEPCFLRHKQVRSACCIFADRALTIVVLLLLLLLACSG